MSKHRLTGQWWIPSNTGIRYFACDGRLFNTSDPLNGPVADAGRYIDIGNPFDPNMKLDRQVRKAIGPIDTELSSVIKFLESIVSDGSDIGISINIKKIQKARYSMDLINEMIKSACNGQPRPWSEFSPMIDEAFS